MVRQATRDRHGTLHDESFQRSGLLFVQAAASLESFPGRRRVMLEELVSLLETEPELDAKLDANDAICVLARATAETLRTELLSLERAQAAQTVRDSRDSCGVATLVAISAGLLSSVFVSGKPNLVAGAVIGLATGFFVFAATQGPSPQSSKLQQDIAQLRQAIAGLEAINTNNFFVMSLMLQWTRLVVLLRRDAGSAFVEQAFRYIDVAASLELFPAHQATMLQELAVLLERKSCCIEAGMQTLALAGIDVLRHDLSQGQRQWDRLQELETTERARVLKASGLVSAFLLAMAASGRASCGVVVGVSVSVSAFFAMTHGPSAPYVQMQQRRASCRGA